MGAQGDASNWVWNATVNTLADLARIGSDVLRLGSGIGCALFNDRASASDKAWAVSRDIGRGLTIPGAGIAAKATFRVAKGIGKAVSKARVSGRIDDVIRSASRPSRVGSKDSRALQALKKKVDRGDSAFSGLPKTKDVANSIIRQTLRARNPIVRTKTQNGKTVRDVFNPNTGRGVRTIDGEFDTFVNLN